jgi:hypothetical protein
MTAHLTPRRASLAIGMILLGIIGGLGGGWLTTYTRAEEVTAERDQAVAEAEANCAQVEALGWACVEDPEDLRGESGAEGPAGPPGPGPSDSQVYAAVAEYLADNPVTADGPSSAEIATAVANHLRDYPPGPTPEQVAAAVASYLTANPPAAGEDGTDGSDGADGATGPPGPEGPQGEPGPPPSAEAVAAAVQEWMEQNPFPDCHEEGWVWEPYTVVTTVGGVDTVLCVAP